VPKVATVLTQRPKKPVSDAKGEGSEPDRKASPKWGKNASHIEGQEGQQHTETREGHQRAIRAIIKHT